MTTEKVNDLELVKLSDYFTPGKFRTIPGTAMTVLMENSLKSGLI